MGKPITVLLLAVFMRSVLIQVQACTTNDDCTDPAVCVVDTCETPAAVDTDCTDNTALCMAGGAMGLECEGSKCKKSNGEDCGSNDECLSTSTCDETCKVKPDQPCTTDMTGSCVDNAACSTDLKCVCNQDFETNGDMTACVATSGGDPTTVAATSAGDTTTVAATSAGDTTVAATSAGDTTVAAGESCSAGQTCVSTTTCDGSVCKINAGESCAGSNENHCQATTTCQSETCKLKESETCSGTNHNCIENASCEASSSGSTTVCTCSSSTMANTEKTQCSAAPGGLAPVIVSLTLMALSVVVCHL